MEENLQQQQTQGYQPQQVPLPNASLILILGIGSILGCCCYGILGVVLGIVALIMAKTANETYQANPSAYTQSSMSNVSTGRICAIIGLILSILSAISSIIWIAMMGFGALLDPQGIINQYS